MGEVNPEARWNVGIDAQTRSFWCQLKQTHCSTIAEMGIMTCPLYWSGYKADGELLELPLREGRNAEDEVFGESEDEDFGWTTIIDASRSFLVSIDIDDLIDTIFSRLQRVSVPPELSARWDQLSCLKSIKSFRNSITDLCLTSSALESLPKASNCYPNMRNLYLNHGHLSEVVGTTCGKEDAMPICQSFPSLKLLDLRHNHLRDENRGLVKSLIGLDKLEA